MEFRKHLTSFAVASLLIGELHVGTLPAFDLLKPAVVVPTVQAQQSPGQCDDGVDNDGDGKIDWSGGVCDQTPRTQTVSVGCGGQATITVPADGYIYFHPKDNENFVDDNIAAVLKRSDGQSVLAAFCDDDTIDNAIMPSNHPIATAARCFQDWGGPPDNGWTFCNRETGTSVDKMVGGGGDFCSDVTWYHYNVKKGDVVTLYGVTWGHGGCGRGAMTYTKTIPSCQPDPQCTSQTSPSEFPPCADGQDNDHDGVIDHADPDCHSDGNAANPSSYDGNRNEQGSTGVPQCQDGLDNDGDGAIDYPADFSCTSATDNDETNAKSQCQNGLDDDGDGKIDAADPACHTDGNVANESSYDRQKNSELPVNAQCNDGLDNDGDGAIDYPADFSCTSATDNDETNAKAQCQDGLDNDGDGKVDLQDPACANNQDNDESPFNGQCNDGLDNDGDGAIDFPADFSCTSATDNDETNAKAQCQDGLDNDGDGKIDGADPACHTDGNVNNPGSYDSQKNSEAPFNAQCNDGLDNDGDGAIDYPADFSCTAATDNDETNAKSQCQDGLDNDGDGVIDTQDPGCSNNQDNDEHNICPVTTTQNSTACRCATTADCTSPNTCQSGYCRPVVYQCNDGLDNDGDGAIDLQDFSCQNNPNKDDESTPKAQCQDGLDNDGDGKVDLQDPACANNQDNDESPFNAQCNDGLDNDGDGAIDYPADFSCTAATDNDETNAKSQCQDGLDNDGDGVIDTQDPGCSNNQDNDEHNICPVTTTQNSTACRCATTADCTSPNTCQSGYCRPVVYQCNDGLDNDGDGAIDFTADFSCTSATDNDETNAKAQCQDGLDNDGDGVIDTQDPGCSNNQDNDEHNICPAATPSSTCHCAVNADCASGDSCVSGICKPPVYQCNDGLDNDGDGAIDYPADPGCTSNQDNDEHNICPVTTTQNSTACRCATTADCTSPNTCQSGYCRPVVYQCNDGLDNDGDGAIDFTADFSCTSATDNDETNAKAQCQDGLDNDGDGVIDTQDPGCSNNQDNDEHNICPAATPSSTCHCAVNADCASGDSCVSGICKPPVYQCNDGLDNDGDGAIDLQDFSCQNNPMKNDESTPKAQCQDGLDNDGDGYIDAQDPACHTDGNVANPATYNPQDNDESPVNPRTITLTSVVVSGCNVTLNYSKQFSTCAHLLREGDNMPLHTQNLFCQNAGPVTVPASSFTIPLIAGTSVKLCNGNNYNECSQTIAVTGGGACLAQCQDGLDNDGDGAIDYPADFSCNASTDNDESMPKAVCQDGLDNDGDGKIDAADPGCHTDGNASNPASFNPQDNDEFNAAQADVSIVKSGPQSVVQGNIVRYTITVFNAGPDTASNVVIQDRIPSGLSFNASQSDVSCVQNGVNILCNNFSLGTTTNDNSKTVFVAFSVPSSYSCPSSISNVATVATSTTDPVSSNNTSQTIVTPVQCPAYQCNDGLDNDGDGAIDYPADFSCTSTTDNDETNARSQCQDGLDNDGDGLIDMQDPGCSNNQDNDEHNICPAATPTSTCHCTVNADCASGDSCVSGICKPPVYQCNDGLDNDGDGAIDLQDFSCQNNPNKNDESAPRSQCQDGLDNDGDGVIDMQDPGCSSSQDNDEHNICPLGDQTCQCATNADCTSPNTCQGGYCRPVTVPICSDGLDNDGDGLIDMQDPGCSNPQDNNEGDGLTDLAITLTGPQTVEPDAVLSYTATLTDIGPDAATSPVGFQVTIPTQFTFESQGTNAACHQNGNVVLCSGITLHVGESKSFTINLRAPSAQIAARPSFIARLLGVSSAEAALICNVPVQSQALITQTPQGDPNISNNTSQTVTTTFTCPPPQFVMAKTTQSTSVQVGGIITYTVTATNTGNVPGSMIRIADNIPTGTSFVQAGSTLGCVQQGTAVVCATQTSVGPGQGLTATLKFQVNPGTQCGPGQNLSNTAALQQGSTTFLTSNAVVTPIACPAQCSDGLDNDSDGAIDLLDFSCQNDPNKNDESTPKAQCQDGIDNDGDGFVDTQDPACHTDGNPNNPLTYNAQDNDESPFNGPQYALRKDASVLSVAPGDTFFYTLTLTNNNPITFPAQLVDPVPSYLTYQPQGSTPGCILQNSQVVCPAQSVAPQQTGTYVLRFSVNDTAPCSADIDNIAYVQVQSVNVANSNIAITHTVCQPPNFSVTKSGPQQAGPSDEIAYTVTAKNNGTTTQNNIQVVDPVPANLTFVPADSTAGCSVQNGAVTCLSQSFTAGQSVPYTLKFQVSPNAQCNSQVTNQASVQKSTVPVATSAAVTTNIVCPAPQFTVTKSGPSTVSQGGTLTYTVTAQNVGTTSQSDVRIADPVGQYLTFQSAGSTAGCAVSSGVVTCPAQSFTPGQFATYTLNFTADQNVPCNTQLPNHAEVQQHGVTFASSSTVQTRVDCPVVTADLSVVKSGPISVTRGGTVTYTLLVTNAGPATAANVVLHDVVPSALTYLSSQGATCTLNTAGTDLSCALGSVLVGQPKTVNVTFSVPTVAQCIPTTITNSAIVQSDTNDPVSTNNQSQVATQLSCPVNNTADLSVTKIGPQSADRGTNVTYTIVASNAGPAMASGVTLTDAIPSNLIYVSSTGANCSQNGSQLVCSLGNLPAASSAMVTATFQVVPTVPACVPGSLVNSVTIASPTTDPIPGNNSAQVMTQITCPVQQQADLAIVKIGPSSVTRGDNIVYSMIVANYGPSTATSVVIHDPIPQGLTFVSSSGGNCSSANGELTCTIASLPSGQSTPIITATFVAPTINGGQCTPIAVTNTATVASAIQDPVSSNNQAQVSTTINCQPQNAADLAFTKIGPQSAVYGSQITYAMFVSNYGPSTAANVVIHDPIPQGLTFVSSSGGSCSVVNGELRCTVTSLPAGLSTPIISATFASTVPVQCAPGSITNDGSVTSDTTDPQSSNNHANVATAFTCPSVTADLSIVKSGPTSVTRGGILTYNIVVTDFGPSSAAANFTVADPIPQGLSFNASASSSGCALSGTTVACSGALSGPNSSTPLQISFDVPTVQNCVPTTVQNTATVRSQLTDPNQGNNTSQTVTTAITCPVNNTADISVLKTGPTSVVRGNTVTYYLTVNNGGPSTAANVVLRDIVPSGFSFVQGGAGSITCSPSGGQVDCAIGSLPVGSTIQIPVIFSVPTVQNCTQTNVQNIAMGLTDTPDPVSSNNQSAVTTSVLCPSQQVDLSVMKTGPSSVVRGNTVTYTLTAQNAGPSTATNVKITDTFPAGFVFSSASGGANCSLSGSTAVSCSIASLAASSSSTVNLVFSVPTVQNCTQTTVVNSAAIRSDVTDPNAGNNVSQVQTTVTCPSQNTADLSITKTGPSSVVRGNTVTYALTVQNFGPSTATNVAITDTLPSGFSYISSNGAATCYATGATAVNCSVASLAPSSSATVNLVLFVPTTQNCLPTTVTNTAAVSSDLTDPVSTNNIAQVQTGITCPAQNADLTVTKIGPTSVVRGNTITYTLTAQNLGPSTATNVVLEDTFPSGFTFSSANGGANCSLSGSTEVGCSIASLPASSSTSVNLVFSVPTVQNCTQTTVTNSVLIRSATTDPNTGNNTGQIQTTVTCPTSNTADVGVSLAGPASVTRGQNLTYTAIVTNGGPSTAQSVQFSLPVPSNLYYVSSSGGNCSVSNGQFTCQMGDMTSGQTTSIQIIFNSQTVTPCSQATLTAQGTVTASTSDPNNSNNTSQSVATTLTCNGGSGTVSVYKTDNRSEASTGDRLRYSIVLTNSSSVSANNVSVTDSVPSGLSIVSVSDGGYINGQTVTWNNISVGANSSRTLYVDADVNSSISDGTVIRNTVYANGQSSTDDTTIRGDGYNDYYDYNNSNRYRYYYQSEPVYYQSSASTNPTVTYPSVVLPQTGDRNAQSFGKTFDNSKLQPATVNANEAPQNAAQPQGQDSGFSAVFYATLVTLFAVGSAAASRMISGML